MKNKTPQDKKRKPVTLKGLGCVGLIFLVITLILVVIALIPGRTAEEQHLWEKGVTYWVGKPWYEQHLEIEYGKGIFTSNTDNSKGWVWYEKADVTFVFDKDTRIIERCRLGKQGDT